MVILDLKQDEGIICNNPEEREAIKELMWKAVKWPEKDSYTGYNHIVFFPVNKSWNHKADSIGGKYTYFEAKLFLNKQIIYETWTY